MSPRVSVAIPSWNGRRFLEVVLPSLDAQEFRDFETIVVDNGSGDGSVEYLAREWPAVRVLALESNQGFAAPVNRAIEQARGEYVALVNNDIELHPSFLGALVDALDAHPGAASAAAKMLSFHDRGVMDHAGDDLYWSGIARPRAQGECDDGRWDEPGEVFSACAGAGLSRRSALDAVGGFDEDFFAYQEDIDWGFRARLAGWGCRYVPAAVAHHMGSATTAGERRVHPLVHRLNRRNSLVMVVKNYPAACLVRNAHLLAFNVALTFAGSIWFGMLRPELEGLAGFARALPRTLRKRAAIQSARGAGRAELEAVVLRRPGELHWARRALTRGR